MIQFSLNNWLLKLTESEAQQYDHKTIDVLVTGDIPDGWNWHLYIAKNCSIDLIPLQITSEGLRCTLLRKHLAYSGSYTAQLYATKGDPDQPDKRSSEEKFTIKQSINGDLKWPEIPTVFTEYVLRAENAAQEAEEASSHYPYIDPETKHWFVWDVNAEDYIDTGIPAGGFVSYQVVDELPEPSAETVDKIYFVPSHNPEQQNVREEYVTLIDDNDNYYWELIGSTAIDISGKEDVANKVTTISGSSTDVQYPSAKAVYDYVEDMDHYIVSDSNPYTGHPENIGKLWVDPTDGSGGGGGGGGGDCRWPIRITKTSDGFGSYDYDFYLV